MASHQYFLHEGDLSILRSGKWYAKYGSL
jgi:hypothetical protein